MPSFKVIDTNEQRIKCIGCDEKFDKINTCEECEKCPECCDCPDHIKGRQI